MKEVLQMGKQKRYSPSFKQKTVETYFQGDLSATELAKNLGIHPHTVRHWIQNFNDGKTENTKIISNENKGLLLSKAKKEMVDNNQDEINEIVSRINTLEKEVENLKTTLLSYLVKLL